MWATFLFVFVEIAAGIRAHSLALLSDAGHNFTDAGALLLAWIAFYVQNKPADDVKTYGYHRAGVLSAFVNALTLIILSGWIFYESILRLRNPEPVQETIMIVIAALGLILNVGIMVSLHAASKDDLNVRSAFVHMLGDAVGSVAIIAARSPSATPAGCGSIRRSRSSSASWWFGPPGTSRGNRSTSSSKGSRAASSSRT
jgi:cobalt-zinc-cadmium efflux system protein